MGFGTTVPGDFGDTLDNELVNTTTKNSLFDDNITTNSDTNNLLFTGNNSGYDDYGKTAGSSTLYGTTADNYNNAGSNLTTGLAGLNKFVNDNKALIGLAGAGSALLSGSGAQKTGYQGSIPQLMAARTMVTKPPTRAQGYRPGAGGIDYGGDVSYVRAPGLDPWAYLSGTSGSAAGADLSSLPADVTTAVNNAITGGTNTKTDTATKTTTLTQAEKDALAVANWKKGLTPQQYLSQINQWIVDHPNLTKAELDAALDKFKVTQTELQTALGTSTMSEADKYALTHGKGLADINQNIVQWIKDNPYATSKQIADAIKGSGVNISNIDRALTDKNTSKGLEYALTHGIGINDYYNNINKYIEDQNRDTTTPGYLEEFSRAKAKQDVGVSDADIAAAQKYLTTEAGKKELAAMYVPQLPKDISGMSESDIFKLYDSQRDAGFTDAQLREAAGKTYGKMSDTDWNYIKTQAGYAGGGEIAIAKGRYLQGNTDGMADKLPAQIGNNQPAALSHGEFVIPADVVSHMGNGNSDAGAKKLYQMMDKIRMARTGNKKQGKKINPDKFMPGGLASAYAKGGSVKHFLTGGSTLPAGTVGTESNLSNWVGDFTTNMLGQGQALSNMPYQAYMGPLTAGQSSLQNQGFGAASSLTMPSSLTSAAQTAGDVATTAKGLPAYSPTTSSFDAAQATAYMNPYLQTSLQPQLEEARRQSQITQQQNAAKMTQAGAFGGSRQALMDTETQRNLGTNLANITGQGYNTAYGNAMSQFNADQQRKMQEAQYGAGYGLQGLNTGLQAAQAQGALGTQINQTNLNNLNAQLTAGTQQREIESEGIAADKKQFEEARANPYKMIQYQQSLLQGLPLAAQSYQGIEPTALVKAAQGATTVNGLLKSLGLID
jgi:hypothetical protein